MLQCNQTRPRDPEPVGTRTRRFLTVIILLLAQCDITKYLTRQFIYSVYYIVLRAQNTLLAITCNSIIMK